MKAMTKEEKQAYRESKQQELEAYTQKLAEGVADLRTSDGYKALLDFTATLHDYSLNNSRLILSQMPSATMVASFNTWKKTGRFVKKGEKGLRIFAPLIRKVCRDDDEDENGKSRIYGYKLVSVFDISQTEGEPVPEFATAIHVSELTGEVENLGGIRDAVQSISGFEVVYGDLPEAGCYGMCDHQEKRITLRRNMSQAQELKTLIHETAHALLHGDRKGMKREAREIEAESVAYVVSAHFGLDTSGYSFGYVASWAVDYDDEQYLGVISGIKKAASDIIEAIEEVLGIAEEVA